MATKNLKGIFITFEGSEGSGKSTHSKFLYRHLKRLKLPVIYVREPGTTKIGEKIRSILLDRRNQINDKAEMLLYMALRNQIVAEIVAPALKQGKIVISDRFLDATVCYQGYGGKVDLDMIKKVGEFAIEGIKPDLTILLDISVREGLKRTSKIFDRIEAKPLSYHERVRTGYLKIAKDEPNRIKVVKVERKISDTRKRILKIVKDKLWLG